MVIGKVIVAREKAINHKEHKENEAVIKKREN
jgi:hypothetical protein